jgi:hypothetical protein
MQANFVNLLGNAANFVNLLGNAKRHELAISVIP